MTELKIDGLIAEGPTQARQYDEALAKRYAEAMNDGAEFPPIVVYKDENGTYVADGFHRLGAARIAGREEIAAEVRKPQNGENAQRSAILYAVGANDEHGKARSNADKQYAVQMLLRDPEWSKWTDREIGRQCRVSHTMVRSQRDKLINSGELEPTETRTTSRGEQTYEQKSPPRKKKKKKKSASKSSNHKGKSASGNGFQMEWTAEDERTYLELKEKWDDATPAAQQFFRSEIR